MIVAAPVTRATAWPRMIERMLDLKFDRFATVFDTEFLPRVAMQQSRGVVDEAARSGAPRTPLVATT